MDCVNKIKLSFPDTTFENNYFTVLISKDVVLISDFDMTDIYAYNKNDAIDYTKDINNIIEKITSITDDKLLTFLQMFKDFIIGTSCYGMNYTLNDSTVDLPKYDFSSDLFWKSMMDKYNVKINRRLRIITYGTVFESSIDDLPKYKIQKTYNAIVLRGGSDKSSISFKQIIKLRGTDLRIQYEIRQAVLFESFIENIISEIEQNDYVYIAIICRAGHHRSVSVAEMLKYLYLDIKCKHLTIE